MGCGCKKNNKKRKQQLTREQVQTKDEKIVKLREAVREQLNTFKRLTKQ